MEARPGMFGKCYGSTTVSERGQIVIPAEARRVWGLEPGAKLFIFGPRGEGAGPLMLMTAEVVTHFVRHAMEHLSAFEEIIKEASEAEDK